MSRSEAQKKADKKYEDKRVEQTRAFFARFNNEEWNIIEQALEKVGSKKLLVLKGAELINKS